MIITEYNYSYPVDQSIHLTKTDMLEVLEIGLEQLAHKADRDNAEPAWGSLTIHSEELERFEPVGTLGLVYEADAQQINEFSFTVKAVKK